MILNSRLGAGKVWLIFIGPVSNRVSWTSEFSELLLSKWRFHFPSRHQAWECSDCSLSSEPAFIIFHSKVAKTRHFPQAFPVFSVLANLDLLMTTSVGLGFMRPLQWCSKNLESPELLLTQIALKWNYHRKVRLDAYLTRGFRVYNDVCTKHFLHCKVLPIFSYYYY